MKTGSRWSSATCTAEVVVVKGADVTLECGGDAMVEGAGTAGATAQGDGTRLGKRYTDEASGLLVLCVKPGSGSLSVGGVPLVEVAAKQLPSSD
jgi:hypothetical protein